MKQIYELSYWLKETANEENQELKKILNEFQFEIIQEIPAKTRKMAYPIKKEIMGKFGTIYFYATPDKIEQFKNKIRKINEILRFIIVKRKYLKLNNESK